MNQLNEKEVLLSMLIIGKKDDNNFHRGDMMGALLSICTAYLFLRAKVATTPYFFIPWDA